MLSLLQLRKTEETFRPYLLL